MKLNTRIPYNIKGDFYYIEAETEDGCRCPLISLRIFNTEEAAEITAAIARAIYAQIESRENFNNNTYEIAVRAALKLINSPDAW